MITQIVSIKCDVCGNEHKQEFPAQLPGMPLAVPCVPYGWYMLHNGMIVCDKHTVEIMVKDNVVDNIVVERSHK